MSRVDEQIYSYSPEPPQEIKSILGKQWRNLDWFFYPSREYGRKDLDFEAVDILSVLEPVLGDPRLIGTVTGIDSNNGCRTLCQTCFTDALSPTKGISRASWEKAWGDKNFQRLFSGSFRWGRVADAGDDKDVAERVQTVLQYCPGLNIGLLVNYRKYKEERILELIDLARRENCLCLTISLPLNRDDQPQRDFELLAIRHLSDLRFESRTSGLQVATLPNGGSIEINDLRQAGNKVAGLGRITAGQDKIDQFVGIEEYDFALRGLSGIHLNPEGLWLQTWVTRFESHTACVWTPLDERTINILSQIPLQKIAGGLNWPGGLGLASNNVRVDRDLAFRTGKPLEARVIE